MAATLRQQIGPAVEEPFARTQAFMAVGHPRQARRPAARRRGRRRRRRPSARRRRRRCAPQLGDDAAGRAGRRRRRARATTAPTARWSAARRGALRRPRRARRRPLRRACSPSCARRLRARLDRALAYASMTRRRRPIEDAHPRRTSPSSSAPPTSSCTTCSASPSGGRTRRGCSTPPGRRRRRRTRQGFCLRRDPGNALLREMSDLGTQFAVLRCLDGTAVPTPRPYFFEADPAVLGAPFLVMEKVPGVVPEPVGSRRPALLRRGRRARASCRTASPTPWSPSTPLDWRGGRARLPRRARRRATDFARREIAKWRALDRRVRRRARPGAHRPALLARRQRRRRPISSRSSTAPTAPATC